jgi:hypothetical protein
MAQPLDTEPNPWRMDCANNPKCTPEMVIEMHVARYKRALLARVNKRLASLGQYNLMEEAHEQEMLEVGKRLSAYRAELEKGNYPEPDLKGVGLCYFEPGETYWSATSDLTKDYGRDRKPGDDKYTHVSCLGSLDMICLEQEYHQARRDSYPSMRFFVTVMPTTEQLRFMLDNWPEMFADLPPCTPEQIASRPESEQKSSATAKASVDDPSDPKYAFNQWVKAKRGW